MDRDNKTGFGRGYCHGVDMLKQVLDKDAMIHGNPSRHHITSQVLTEARDDFVNWLGESKYMYGLNTIPPSRFSNTNANGLWEYSPFLCGVGLLEALELAQCMGLYVFDRTPEAMCLIHLHNMLVQKGLISRPVGLYDSLQGLLPDAFFLNGTIPKSNFGEALTSMTNSHRPVPQSREMSDYHDLVNPAYNRFFRTKSVLRLYRDADWIPERIPDEDIPISSALFMLRISQIKHVTNAAGNKVLESTPLVERARRQGLTDSNMMDMGKISEAFESKEDQESRAAAIEKTAPKGYSHTPDYTLPTPKSNLRQSSMSGADLLKILKLDIVGDVTGHRPICSEYFFLIMSTFSRCWLDSARLAQSAWDLAESWSLP